MHNPILLAIAGVILAAIAFAVLFYGGRWLLQKWDIRAARLAGDRRRRYSMTSFRGAKASEWHR